MGTRKLILLPLLLISSTFAATKEIELIITKPIFNHYKNSHLLFPSSQTRVISKDQIISSGANSISEILNANSSIQIQSTEPGRSIISMRGFGDNAVSNTLILYNGQPYFNPDIGTLAFNILPLTEIEQIEIVPGSGSILYGDQAVGGMVNIITKTREKTANKIFLSAGNFSTIQTQFIFGGTNQNNFGYNFAGSIYTTNNYREHNAERINNFTANFTYKNASLHYRKINQHLELPGKLTADQVRQNPRQAENNIAYNNQDHDIVQFGFDHQLLPNWATTFDLTLKAMHGRGAYAWDQKIMPFDEARQVATLRPKISGTIDLKNRSISPILGLDVNYAQYEYNNLKNTQNQNGFYGQINIPLTTKVSTILGSRYGLASYHLSPLTSNQTNPINRAFITSLELIWQARDNLSCFIKRAENFRFPKTDEMFTLDNMPLKTQAGVSYELGLTYKKSGFTSILNVYRLDLKNEIMAVPITTAKYFVYNKNLDPTRRDGIIFNFSWDLVKYLQLKTDYNFINAEFLTGDFAGKKIPFVAKNNLRLAAILKPQNNLQLLVESIYTGKRYPINDVENRGHQIGGFTTYNFSIIYEKNHYTLAIRGNNLTNKLHYGYAVTTYQDAQSSSWFYPSVGINVLATLTIKI